jgi:glycosyltransferase involved in cell wall biosynthesis
MKVIHITITSEVGGGPEHLYQLIRYTRDKVTTYIACPNVGPYFLKYNSLVREGIYTIPHRKFALDSLIGLLNFINREGIQIIHCHGKGAGVYGKLLKVLKPKLFLIHTPHGVNNERSLRNHFYFLFEKVLGFLISTIIYVSKSEAQLANRVGIWKKLPFTIIPNGTPNLITSDEYFDRTINKRYESSSFKVLTCSRFDTQKNTLEFLEIAKNCPKLSFLILGDGELKSECEEFVRFNKMKNVEFLGNVDNPKEFMLDSHIYLSTALWEGLSIAIIEAMSAGLPIVASKVVGNIDLVFSGNIENVKNGFTYELGDIIKASCLLDSLSNNRELYIELSKGSINIHKERFSVGNMAAKVLNLYSSLT